MTHRGIHLDGRAITGTDPGPAPVLQWLPIDRLVIDEDYQRPLAKGNWASIEKIAANFQWSRFAPVLVAPVAGGLYAVIDGQHRSHAAAMCGIREVPAMVVEVGLAEQSRAFAWINSQAVRVTVFHVFKAALAAKEDWAMRAAAAVASAGCRLMPYNSTAAQKQAGQVFCLGFIRKQIEAGADDAIRLGLTAVRAAHGLGDRSVAYSDYLLRPWIMAVGLSMCRDVALLTQVLEAENPFKVIERAGPGGARNALVARIERFQVAR